MKQSINLFLCITVFCMMTFSSCKANSATGDRNLSCPAWVAPDSIAFENLGNRMANILFSPQKVKCYKLIAKETIEKNDYELEKNFVRDSLLANLTKDQIETLQFVLISDSCNYKNDSIIVMSPYLPYLEFEFTKKKETVHLLISTSDFSWTILYDGKRQFRYNYVNERIISRFCNFFMNNKK